MSKDRSKILIIEDQPGERETLERFLRTENYDVVSAAGSRAAQECMQDSFDLVLSDVRLGGDSGMDLLRARFVSHARCKPRRCRAILDPAPTACAVILTATFVRPGPPLLAAGPIPPRRSMPSHASAS